MSSCGKHSSSATSLFECRHMRRCKIERSCSGWPWAYGDSTACTTYTTQEISTGFTHAHLQINLDARVTKSQARNFSLKIHHISREARLWVDSMEHTGAYEVKKLSRFSGLVTLVSALQLELQSRKLRLAIIYWAIANRAMKWMLSATEKKVHPPSNEVVDFYWGRKE